MDIGTFEERMWFYEIKSVIIQIVQSNSKVQAKNSYRLQYINQNMAILYAVIS
jgi:hypothetical protein